MDKLEVQSRLYGMVQWVTEHPEAFQNPVHYRQIIGGLWYALGKRLIAGIPVPIGEEIKIRMGDPYPYKKYEEAWEVERAEWEQVDQMRKALACEEYREAARKALDELATEEDTDETRMMLEEERQHEALSRQADDEEA